jgi:hypothetical protein
MPCYIYLMTTPPAYCATCGKRLPIPHQTGRKPRYCFRSGACRQKAYRRRVKAKRSAKLQPETSVYPYDLYQCWMGDNYPDQVEQVRDFPRQSAATIALHSLSTHAIGIDNIFLLHWLKDPSEMLLMQGRWDEVYYDEGRTQKAFSHHAGQWQFYKGGSFLYTIAESKIQYEDDAGVMQQRIILPDGFHDTTFFIDWRRKPFLALSAQQQEFVRGYRILSICPHFSFDAARRK